MATKFPRPAPLPAGGLTVHRDWLLTPHRAALHRPSETAVVADLHLGYDLARCQTGEAIPALSIAEAVADLKRLFAGAAVRRLVVAGDLVENRAGKEQVQSLLAWLSTAGVELVALVPGNHDRANLFPGVPCFPEGFDLGGWRVVHGDRPLPEGSLILGHFHPCLRWGGTVSASCYLVGERHIVLPAFSRDAKGANVLGVRRWEAYRCAVVVGGEVLDFGGLKRLAEMKQATDPGRQRSPKARGPRRRDYQ